MRKLLLTSEGFYNPNLGKKFVELVGKPASEIKLLFIPTAANVEEDPWWVKDAEKNLEKLEINNITKFDVREVSWNDIKDFDAMYVCGGNSCYLMKRIRETGFDKVLKRFISEGKVYVGESAGSCITAEYFDKTKFDFENDIVGLTDFTGFGYTKGTLWPHFTKKDEKERLRLQKDTKYEIRPLRDRQAILILGDKEVLFE